MLSLTNEVECIESLKQGDYAAFDMLYNHYADSLYFFVLKMTKSPTEAKDIIQETFVKVWDKRSTISSTKSFKSFVFAIARNLTVDSFRANVNSVDFELFLEKDDWQRLTNPIQEKINYDDFLRILSIAKKKLTKKQRLIFELSKEKGYTTVEIAQYLAVSEKTIRNQLSIIVSILRKEVLLAAILFLAANCI